MIGNKIFSQSNNLLSTYCDDKENSGVVAQLYVKSESFPYIYRIGQITTGTGSSLTSKNIKIFLSEPILASSSAKSLSSQLNDLRSCAGLNITELATILQVQRPTIYEWLESNNKPSRKNQERLDKIYIMLKPLLSNNTIGLRDYLYKKYGDNESLFDLLIKNNLNERLITSLINKINEAILLTRNQISQHRAILHREKFEPVSEEQKKKSLNKLIRRIG